MLFGGAAMASKRHIWWNCSILEGAHRTGQGRVENPVASTSFPATRRFVPLPQAFELYIGGWPSAVHASCLSGKSSIRRATRRKDDNDKRHDP